MSKKDDLEQLEARLATLETNVQETVDESGENAERFRSIKERFANVRTDMEELKASRLEHAGDSNKGEATKQSTIHQQESANNQSGTLHNAVTKAQQDAASEDIEESIQWLTLDTLSPGLWPRRKPARGTRSPAMRPDTWILERAPEVRFESVA